MRVLLDGSELSTTGRGLRSALDAARVSAQARGRVIVEAKFDGHPLGDDELAAPGEEPLGGGTLELLSADPGSLVRVTLQELQPLLDEARGHQRSAAGLISTGDMAKAMESLARAFEIWGSVHQAVSNGAELLGLELDSIRIEPTGTIADCAVQLAAGLSEIKRALAAQDLPGLSDVLLYEMDEQIGRWQSALTAMADRATSSNPAGVSHEPASRPPNNLTRSPPLR